MKSQDLRFRLNFGRQRRLWLAERSVLPRVHGFIKSLMYEGAPNHET